MRLLALLPLIACQAAPVSAPEPQSITPSPTPSPDSSNDGPSVTPTPDGLLIDINKFGPTTSGEFWLWQTPSDRVNAVSASVTLSDVDFHGVAFTVRASPVAYGADAYMNVYLNGKIWAEIGFNPRDHWNGPLGCFPKDRDDVFFIGLAANNPTHGNVGDTSEWTNDIRILTPVGVSPLYADNTTYSAAAENGRIVVRVNGVEIEYRDAGNPRSVPSRFDNTAAFTPTGSDTVRIELAVLSDGASSTGCLSPASPFVPGVGPVRAAVVWSSVLVR